MLRFHIWLITTLYYKMRQILLKMPQQFYFKMLQKFVTKSLDFLLQNATILLQNMTVITKCVHTQRDKSWNNLRLYNWLWEPIKHCVEFWNILFCVEKFAKGCEDKKFLCEEFNGIIPLRPLDSRQTLFLLKDFSKMLPLLKLKNILLHFIRRLMQVYRLTEQLQILWQLIRNVTNTWKSVIETPGFS